MSMSYCTFFSSFNPFRLFASCSLFGIGTKAHDNLVVWYQKCLLSTILLSHKLPVQLLFCPAPNQDNKHVLCFCFSPFLATFLAQKFGR